MGSKESPTTLPANPTHSPPAEVLQGPRSTNWTSSPRFIAAASFSVLRGLSSLRIRGNEGTVIGSDLRGWWEEKKRTLPPWVLTGWFSASGFSGTLVGSLVIQRLPAVCSTAWLLLLFILFFPTAALPLKMANSRAGITPQLVPRTLSNTLSRCRALEPWMLLLLQRDPALREGAPCPDLPRPLWTLAPDLFLYSPAK